MAHPVLELLFGPSIDDGDDRIGNPRAKRNTAGSDEIAQSTARRLERIRAGDETVLAELYDLYFRDLAALAFRFVRERSVAQDVVHDVFLRVWTLRETMTVRTTLEAYLFQAVTNRALDVVAQTRRDRKVFPLLSNDAHFEALKDASVRKPSPHGILESENVSQVIVGAIARLPERQSLALTLRLVNDMTYEEIGTVLGITKASVAELIRKAQAHLKPVLEALLP